MRKAVVVGVGLLWATGVAAQGPALILTPDPGVVTFKIAGPPRDWMPPYRVGINAQGQEWEARTGTPWVNAVVRGTDLYLSVNREAWSLGPGMTHCATVALQARKRDDAGASTAAVADSARVNVCVVRTP